MQLFGQLLFFIQFILCCNANNIKPERNAQATTTVWWTPTSSYLSTWVGTSTSTYIVAVTQQANVIVTLTSYIPCPVTSTTLVYVCQACQSTQAQPVGVGTTTETLYTTTTLSAQAGVRTTTSGGYVVVIVDSTTATSTATGSATQLQVISEGRPAHDMKLLCIVAALLSSLLNFML